MTTRTVDRSRTGRLRAEWVDHSVNPPHRVRRTFSYVRDTHISRFVDEPGFHKDQREGKFRFNDYERITGTIRPGFTAKVYDSEGKLTREWINYTEITWPEPEVLARYLLDREKEFIGDLASRAKLAAEARLLKSEVSIGTTIGELPETIGYGWSLLKRIRNEYYVLLKKAARRPGSTLDAAQFNLELRYAIRPLIVDFCQWYEYFRKKARQTKGAAWPLASGRHKGTRQIELEYQKFGPEKDAFSLVIEGNLLATVSKGIRYIEYTPSWQRDIGLTRRHIIPTAWELTKFSWAIDWFVDVGNWLSSLSASLDPPEIIGAWTTYQLSFSGTLNAHGTKYDGGTVSASPNWCHIQLDYKNRVCDRGPYSFGAPVTWDPNLDGWKILDLTSLVVLYTDKVAKKLRRRK